MENTKIAAVAIIENSRNQLLLLNRNYEPYGFCLSGGKINIESESVVQGLCRELKEEIGADINQSALTLQGTYESVNGLTVYVFKYANKINKVELSPEHSGYFFTNTTSNINFAGNTEKFLETYQFDSLKLGMEHVLDFGKYNEASIEMVYQYDTQYLIWLHENTQHKLQKRVILSARTKLQKEQEYIDDLQNRDELIQYENISRQNNLRNSVDTPFGKAISTNDGNHKVIDDLGNDTGKIIHNYYGWHDGSWGADL